MNKHKHSRNAIRRSLSIFSCVIFSITALIIILSACISSFTIISENKRDSYYNATLNRAHMISGWFDEKCGIVDTLALNVGAYGYDGERFSESENYLESMMSVDPSIYAIYLGRPDKSSAFSDHWDAEAENYDPTTRDWYKNSVESEKTVISSPYIDADTGKPVITFSKAVRKNGELTSVLACDIFVTSLVELVTSEAEGKEFSPILIDAEKNIVVHENEAYLPNADNNGETVTVNVNTLDFDTYSDAWNKPVYSGEDYTGDMQVFAKVKLEKYDWSYISVIDFKTFYSSEFILIFSYIALLLLAVVVNAVVINILIKKKLAPLDELRVASDSMVNGRLEYTASYRKDDEIGIVCKEVERANHKIAAYIIDIQEKLRCMGEGKFNNDINMEYSGDFENIKTSMNAIQRSLKSTLLDIGAASSKVTEGAQSLAAGSQELSSGTIRQAEAVEELSETFKSVSKQISGTADNANQASGLVSEMGVSADKCILSMQELTLAMTDIAQKSDRIKKIVATVEDIAFQTNILALNASIEASRAGAAGKGFDVVANEVRSLAARSKEAAENTTELIELTTEAISKGSNLTQSTSELLDSLVKSAQQAAVIVNDIAEDAVSENKNLQSMTSGVEQIASVVRANTTTAKDSAASSVELCDQAAIMQSHMKKFVI